MSEDELESIRQEKREAIVENAAAPDAPDEPIHVGSVEEFSTVTTDHGVVLVDFYADWCGPCNMLEPVVESVAANTEAAVAKVDIDEHQGLASQYGVRSVPTLVLFADGEQVEQVVGMQDEAALTRLVDRYA
ncbi:thioredoxin (plasmid) [Halorussus salilacus]|uniref:thioredoxin n=1 Tax=Halorussus salilacus TaxID=2953750 RepID=UPI00209E58E9|nr:thioredoxin [Halorussus salilacus]USZ69969.1 thioredoxin [Halorussus salilacus]